MDSMWVWIAQPDLTAFLPNCVFVPQLQGYQASAVTARQVDVGFTCVP